MRLQLLYPHDLPSRVQDFGAVGPVAPAAWSERETGRTAERFALLDRFFGLTRVAGAASFLGESAAVSQERLREHVAAHGSSLEESRLAEVVASLELVQRVSVGGLTIRAPQTAPVLAGDTVTPADPHRTWRVGHQAFFPLIQGALAGLRVFMTAATESDDEHGRQALEFTAECMAGSIRAMEFAADFRPRDYREKVRPSMAPPFLPQGLSGLMSADHHHLVKTYPAAAWVVRQSAPEVREAYDALVSVVESSYAAHVHVCDRFEGSGMASLRMSESSEMAATEVIRRMGRSRVEVLRREG